MCFAVVQKFLFNYLSGVYIPCIIFCGYFVHFMKNGVKFASVTWAFSLGWTSCSFFFSYIQ